jgi:hypothetical protein
MDAQGNWAKAAGHWTSVVLATPNAMVYANRGNCYLKMKKVQKGRKKNAYIHMLLQHIYSCILVFFVLCEPRQLLPQDEEGRVSICTRLLVKLVKRNRYGLCVYIRMCTYIYICTYIHVYIHIYVSIHTYVSIYIYVYVCIYVYTYIYIYSRSRRFVTQMRRFRSTHSFVYILHNMYISISISISIYIYIYILYIYK